MSATLQNELEKMSDAGLTIRVEKLNAQFAYEGSLSAKDFVWLTFAETILEERRKVGVEVVDGHIYYPV